VVARRQEEHIRLFDELLLRFSDGLRDPSGQMVGQPPGVESILKLPIAVVIIVHLFVHG
jgi:hypothetical protein